MHCAEKLFIPDDGRVSLKEVLSVKDFKMRPYRYLPCILLLLTGIPAIPVLADPTDEILDFTITVDVNDDASLNMTYHIKWKVLDDSIGYIYISGFHGQVVREVKDALDDLRGQGMEALVLDVRDDLGGSLSDVCDIADIFLPKNKVITTVRSRVNKEQVYRTHSDGLDMPIAMLVNGYSASASELLSGALKDNGAAELFGTVTFGKGIVQTFFNINFGRDGTIKFTTDAYYTPADVCIQGTGITPDHIVELPEGLTYYNIPSIPYESDTQLQAAVEYLRGLDR